MWRGRTCDESLPSRCPHGCWRSSSEAVAHCFRTSCWVTEKNDITECQPCKITWGCLSERCMDHDVLTHLDLDNNQVKESKSVAHFDNRPAMLISDNMLERCHKRMKAAEPDMLRCHFSNQQFREIKILLQCCVPEMNGQVCHATYLGPVHPMVVPRPPLSFSTASLSSSFLVASMSAFPWIMTRLKKDKDSGSNRWWGTFRRGLQRVVRHHHLVGGRVDLGPLDELLVAALVQFAGTIKRRRGQIDAETGRHF